MVERPAKAEDETVVGDTPLFGDLDDGAPVPEIDARPPLVLPAGPDGRSEAAPRHLGRYLVLGTLGQGGMGKVLRAHDETLGRDVALKVLHDVAGGRREQRLLREAQALARLSHPNVVSIYDVGAIDGRLYIAMELVEGVTLDRWQHERRPWLEVLEVYCQAGRGLAAAHAEGLVHRDFKPANCMLDAQGRVKVLDFGLARGLGTVTGSHATVAEVELTHESQRPVASDHASEVSRRALEQPLTRTGTRLGTPAYMSPEQILGQPADPRSDQFAFCVSLHEALYGVRPFVGATPRNIIFAVEAGRISTPALPAGLPAVPQWLNAALRRGLAAEGHERHRDMEALLAVLERGIARRRALRGAALGAVLLTGLGWGLAASGAWQREQPCEGLRDQPMPAWTDEDRRAVGEAIAASGVPEASRMSERIVGRLDAYADAWTDARADACEATLVRHEVGEQALVRRRACLDERVTYMQAAVGELAGADSHVAAHAAEVVDGLPELATCDDVEALLRGPEPVPEALAGEAEEVRGLIARSWISGTTGNEERGVQAAERAVALAEALDGAPVLQLEALQNRGYLLRLARRWPEARRDLSRALELAERHEIFSREIDVLAELVLLANDEEDASAAEAWLSSARGKLARMEGQSRRVAQRWWLESVVAMRSGRLDEAVASAEQAVSLYEQLDPRAEREHFDALMLLGRASRRHGDLERAHAAFEAARALADDAGRPPLLAEALHMLGFLEYSRGQLDAAQPFLERALILRDAFFGPRSAASIRSRHLLAVILRRQGRLPEALEHASRAAQSLDERVPVQLQAEVHEIAAVMHREGGRWDEAIASYRDARTAWSSLPAPDRVQLALLDVNVADCMRSKHELEAARALYDGALAVLAVHTPTDDPRRAYALLGRARLWLAQGQRTAAIADLHAGVELRGVRELDPNLEQKLRETLDDALVEERRDERKRDHD